MLTLDHVTIEQGDFRLTADFTLADHSRTAVMGPSGSGKSTLLATIAGFVTPSRGRILWNGQDITPIPPGDRPVSVLFQDNNLFPHLTIAQNTGLALAPRLRLSAAESRRIHDALDRVGLSGMADRKPAALSGGQQSRAALARVFLADRPLVLMDEPFAALGPALRAEMLDLAVATLGESGRTILLVTHDPADAFRLGGDLILVDSAIALPPANAAQMLDHPTPALRNYLGKTDPA